MELKKHGNGSMNRPKQAVILCGGLGTRLRPFTENTPKPMMLCNGKPFLWYLLQQLNEQKVKRFVLLTGYLAEKIEDYFNDGSNWGWQIEYSKGPVEWDTGKRIWEAKEKIDGRFLLLYSDNFVPFSLENVHALHEKNNKTLSLMVAPKKSSNISMDKDGNVIKYDNSRSDTSLNYVEIGYMIIEKDKMLSFYDHPDCSFSLILHRMAEQKQISGWVQNDQYHSISDIGRWKKTEEYLKPKKLILIDRDGVINQKAPRGEYIAKWEEFIWIAETRVAMKLLAQKGFKFIVISNQAGIARGMINKDNLECIHKNMTAELKKDGIDITDIYVCPHHWNDNCDCRKPNPGMLFQASHKHLFRLDKTLFIGDDPRDCQTAKRAGCKSIFIGNTHDLKMHTEQKHLICVKKQLSDCVPNILNYFQ